MNFALLKTYSIIDESPDILAVVEAETEEIAKETIAKMSYKHWMMVMSDINGEGYSKRMYPEREGLTLLKLPKITKL